MTAVLTHQMAGVQHIGEQVLLPITVWADTGHGSAWPRRLTPGSQEPYTPLLWT